MSNLGNNFSSVADGAECFSAMKDAVFLFLSGSHSGPLCKLAMLYISFGHACPHLLRKTLYC